MKIIFWSGTGNTEKMADFISEGINDAGKSCDVLSVSSASVDSILNEDVLILGCPAMGSEELEPAEFEPFINTISDKISGKKAVLFGSYGWGDGEWMDAFKEQIINCGCEVPIDPLIIQYEPDDNKSDCVEFGKKIALL